MPVTPCLHVTNGDSAVGALRHAGFRGRFLPWRDVLHEGPVPEGLAPAALAEVRAAFIADQGWADVAHALHSFRERDRLLDRIDAFDEVVLWFEHDLYDQLQLIQVLDRIAARSDPTHVFMTIEADFIGMRTAERLQSLHAERRPVTDRVLATAARAWAAFRAPDPTGLAETPGADFEALPFLHGAFRRLLEEYPAPGTGLGRTERQLLEAVAGGSATPARAFRASQAHEEASFMGDAPFWKRLHRLLACAEPLIHWLGPAPVRFPPAGPEDRDALDLELAPTAAGRAVLDGDLDHVAVNGCDRWIGGVLLGPGNVWRYDPAGHRLLNP